MNDISRRYAGPLAVIAMAGGLSAIWVASERGRIQRRGRMEVVMHADRLATELRVMAGSSPNGQDLALMLEERLELHPPFRYVMLVQDGHPTVRLGPAPEAPPLASDAVLEDRDGLLLVRRTISVATPPAMPPPPAHDEANGPPGPAWHWRLPAREASAAGALVMALDAAVPPHPEKHFRLTVVPIMVAVWLAIGAIAFAWARSIRAQTVIRELEEETQRRNRLEDLNLTAAGLAHETMNPLGIIHGLAQRLANDDRLEDETRSTAEALIEEADRAAGRLSDFINFARRKDASMKVHDLEAVMDPIVQTLRHDFEAAHVSLESELPSLHVRCDRAMTEKIVVNLLLNALEASTSGGTTTLTCASTGPSVSLTVRDDGHGIEPNRLPDIFRPYVTGHAEGHGLGLAIVKQLVEQQGWTIEVSSERGRGTTFTIEGVELVEGGADAA